jgi:8-oxo-dGTP diphosphatase
MSLADYAHPVLTVDVVAFTQYEGRPRVLLIRRRKPPFEGAWALPGGFVEVGESLEEAARRELEEETGLRDVRLEQFHAFGDPGRDPRGHTVTVAYWSWVPSDVMHHVRGGDDAAEARWWPLDDLPPLAFDHADIISYARDQLS